MILSYDDIVAELTAGRLLIETPPEWAPFDESQIRESSIDLRVGREFYRWMWPQEIERDPGASVELRRVRLSLPEAELVTELGRLQRTFTRPVQVSEEGLFLLQPGDFALTTVVEKITLPNYLAARVEGRTRFARLGLEVHSTAPTIRAGWSGHITLELKNVNPALSFEIAPGAMICQLILERVLTPFSVQRRSYY